MNALSRHDLAKWLAARSIDRQRMTWAAPGPCHRVLIRQSDETTGGDGPHRLIRLPADGATVKIPLGDRPALSGFVAALFVATNPVEVCAFEPAESYWLNNRGYAAYLSKVADARRVSLFLRRAGLSDGFRGGFLIRPYQFETHVPVLAAQPFCGGPDVMFAADDGSLLILACHEFDLHLEARDPALAAEIVKWAAGAGLRVLRGLAGPAEIETGEKD